MKNYQQDNLLMDNQTQGQYVSSMFFQIFTFPNLITLSFIFNISITVSVIIIAIGHFIQDDHTHQHPPEISRLNIFMAVKNIGVAIWILVALTLSSYEYVLILYHHMSFRIITGYMIFDAVVMTILTVRDLFCFVRAYRRHTVIKPIFYIVGGLYILLHLIFTIWPIWILDKFTHVGSMVYLVIGLYMVSSIGYLVSVVLIQVFMSSVIIRNVEENIHMHQIGSENDIQQGVSF